VPPTATVRWLPAPTLLAPADGERFVGWHAKVILRWSPVAGQDPDEYYVVRIPFNERGDVAEFWRQETSLRAPSNFSLPDVGPADRGYTWTVQVQRCVENCERVLDDAAQKRGTAVGDVSAPGLFYWDTDIQINTPTPRP
jgi:hypothetical protein